jgi:hypothetical protein
MFFSSLELNVFVGASHVYFLLTLEKVLKGTFVPWFYPVKMPYIDPVLGLM